MAPKPRNIDKKVKGSVKVDIIQPDLTSMMKRTKMMTTTMIR
jgi:hypothetical protein